MEVIFLEGIFFGGHFFWRAFFGEHPVNAVVIRPTKVVFLSILLCVCFQKLFFLQAKEAVLKDDIYCPTDKAVLLASLSVSHHKLTQAFSDSFSETYIH